MDVHSSSVKRKTDMAVVVSQSQNEIEDFKKKVAQHRRRIVKEDFDMKFKDPLSRRSFLKH